MDCRNCKPVARKMQFASGGEAGRFVRSLRRLVEDGRLTEFPSFTDLSEIEDDCSWPDVIECHFGCPDCGRQFTLKASSHSRKPPEWQVRGGRA
jgi:hypothetical protein